MGLWFPVMFIYKVNRVPAKMADPEIWLYGVLFLNKVWYLNDRFKEVVSKKSNGTNA